MIYPSPYDYLDVGERELKYAFQGSTTTTSKFNKWDNSINKSHVIKASNERLKDNASSKIIINYNQFMKNQRDNSFRSIRITDLWENMQLVKEKIKHSKI